MAPRGAVRAAVIALLAVCVPACAVPAAAGDAATGAAPRPGPTAARVIYVTGGSIYVDAGRSQGVAVGDTLEVRRDGAAVARLRVAFVSATKSSCDTLAASAPVRVGDAVVYRARTPDGPAAAGAGAAAANPSYADSAGALPPPAPLAPSRGGAAQRRVSPLRGRVGVGLVTVPAAAGAPGYTQPSLTLRLTGAAERGAPLDFSIDVRSHRSYHGGESDGATRVYALSASFRDGSGHRRITVGRQSIPVSTSAGLFDGALAQMGGPRWSAGVFSGVEPDPAAREFSTDVVQIGAYYRRTSAPGAAGRWTAAAGFMDSRDQGNPNRDFAFVQGSWMSPRVLASFSQELDFNAGWKQDLGDPAVSWTSTYLSARVQASRRFSVSTGYDTRRSVRLYRDHETPVTEFDDRYRQGGWLGVGADATRALRLGLTSRVRGGGADGSALSTTGSLDAYRLTRLQGILQLRSTRVDSDVEEGWLHSGSLGFTPRAGLRLTGSAGAQRFTDLTTDLPRTVDWQSLDADLGLARRWYLLLSVEHDSDDAGDRVQSYSSLNWIF
jgi:hypothetical protein